MKKSLLLILTLSSFLFATEGKDFIQQFTGDNSNAEFEWTKFSGDAFVMGNSLIANKTNASGAIEEKCVSQSSFELVEENIPRDARVEKVFLVWMGSVDPEIVKKGGLLDNSVKLEFVPDSYNGKLENDVEAPQKRAEKQENSFEFEFISGDDFKSDLPESEKSSVGFFTYRVDVTDFFHQIQVEGEDKGFIDNDTLIGKYTLSGLNCSEDEIYKKNDMMLSAWSIVVIYNTPWVNTKNIYLYPAFKTLKNEKHLNDFNFKYFGYRSFIKLTSFVGGGKGTSSKSEGMKIFIDGSFIDSEGTIGKEFHANQQCVDKMQKEKKTSAPFDSISTIPFINSDGTIENRCLEDNENVGVDIDTFISPKIEKGYYKKDLTGKVEISGGDDRIFPNFLLMSHDMKLCRYKPVYELKPLRVCSNFKEPGDPVRICAGRDFYVYMHIKHHCWYDSLINPSIKLTFEGDVEYIPGSAEMSYSADKNYNGTDWKPVADKEEGKIPFDESFVLKEKLGSDDDPIIIRFGLRHLKKTAGYIRIKSDLIGDVITRDQPSEGYLVLYLAAEEECPESPLDICGDSCGGCNPCSKDSECPEGYICEKTESKCRLAAAGEETDVDQNSGDKEIPIPDYDKDPAPREDKKSSDGCSLSLI